MGKTVVRITCLVVATIMVVTFVVGAIVSFV